MSSPPDPYLPAAICRRGHFQTGDTETNAVFDHCPECGAPVLTGCLSCGRRIRGWWRGGIDAERVVPPFCEFCGSPHPWADRKSRVYQLENLLDAEDLDEPTRLKVHSELEALSKSDLPEEEEAQRWRRVKEMAPGLIDAGQRIIESVVSAAIRAQVGL